MNDMTCSRRSLAKAPSARLRSPLQTASALSAAVAMVPPMPVRLLPPVHRTRSASCSSLSTRRSMPLTRLCRGDRSCRHQRPRSTQQNAQNDQSACQTIASTLVNENCDLILAIATPAAQAVAGATSDIPIVCTAITDFAASGCRGQRRPAATSPVLPI